MPLRKALPRPRSLIGQSAPLTGANAELGKDIRNGALAYFRKVNDAGGVHGRKVELVSLDDANTVQRSGENTQKLVEEQKVFALFGYASATLSRPALPLVAKHNVPFLSPFTGADPMRVFDKNVYNMRAQLRRRAGEDRRPLRAARREALLDRLLRRRRRPREPGGGRPRAEEAQLRHRVGRRLQGPRQARHRERREGSGQGPARRRHPDHAVQGVGGLHQGGAQLGPLARR